jgi:8-oxo-dGTP diphosphatase
VSGSRLYPDRPFLAASIAVMREGRVLLAARAHPPGANVLSLPGGVVELGESLAEAALRELHEEVGVEARIVGLIGPVEVVEKDSAGTVMRHFVVLAHLAHFVSGEPRTGPEALSLRWVAESELAALESEVATTPGLLPILRRAFALDRGEPGLSGAVS